MRRRRLGASGDLGLNAISNVGKRGLPHATLLQRTRIFPGADTN